MSQKKIMHVLIVDHTAYEKMQGFKLKFMEIKTRLTRKQVLRVMDRLSKEGYVHEISDNRQPLKAGQYGVRRRNPAWRLSSAKTLGERPPIKRRDNTARQKIWESIRRLSSGLGRFSTDDIQSETNANRDTLNQYLQILKRAGYVVKVPNTGRKNYWLLQNDPGPVRPLTREK